MIRVRRSSIVLVTLLGLLALLLALRDVLHQAHIDESILYFSSDGSVHDEWYDTVYGDSNVLETLALFVRGSPILFMTLTSDGNLLRLRPATSP